MVSAEMQAKAETVLQQAQAVEDCRLQVKKSTSKIDYASPNLVLPLLVQVAASSVDAQDDHDPDITMADDVSFSSSSSSLTHDDNLNDGPSAAPNSNSANYNNIRSQQQGETKLENSGNLELKEQNEKLQKTVKECYYAVTNIQKNADLKLQKLELEITHLRRALADATTVNQRLKICVETRELQQITCSSGSDGGDASSILEQRLKHRDRAVEKHLTSMLTARNQAVKENYQLRKMVLKSCFSCRTKVSTAIRHAKSAITETSSEVAVANLPLDMSEHSNHSPNRSKMNESVPDSSCASPRPSPMHKRRNVMATPLPGSPRKGILKNSMGFLPPPAVHYVVESPQDSKARTPACTTPQQSPVRQAPKPKVQRAPTTPSTTPKKSVTTFPRAPKTPTKKSVTTIPRAPTTPATTPKMSSNPPMQSKPRPAMIAQTSTSSIVDSVPLHTGKGKSKNSPRSDCSMTLVSDLSSVESNGLSSSTHRGKGLSSSFHQRKELPSPSLHSKGLPSSSQHSDALSSSSQHSPRKGWRKTLFRGKPAEV
jgi:hypothetical protein